ncbi:MAG: flagellar biosynthesis protein FlhA [Candidatus Cloacimonetes bacterium]|jgi:flagellar biosynthesis protein FlhA|nr:flagellar biosynthesis protein FlhA [Candidatus Cloacimonadota bacterium]MDD4156568.1 flagellar biosynthesis protein FlhA [Candidatus Cloacimonadota bacterium]
MAEKKSSLLIKLGNQSSIAIMIGVIAILAILLFPMPALMIDSLLVLNFMLAFVILLSPLYLLKPVEFSVYPGLLLIITLFRLSLNVATTRAILSSGNPGQIIEVFGKFMIGGNYVVGIIIFIIIFIINFIVVVKGSGRVAEVAARFTLDSLPGRQMAIDADLNNGIITDAEARQRRDDVRREADFYGAMDGASKFVSGDAKAGIMVLFINLIGGIVIGMVQMNMTFLDAADKFTILTIGDGLVSQIPGLLISISAGVIVTRAGTKANLGEEVLTQLFKEPKVLYATAVIMAVFAFAPGMPWYLFLPVGLGIGYFGYMISKSEMIEVVSDDEKALNDRKELEQKMMETESANSPEEKSKEIAAYMQIDPLELEIGYSLISLVDEKQKGDLLDRVSSLRKQLAIEIGMVVPPIRIRDNISLVPNQYVVKIRGEEITSYECLVNHYLALDPGTVEKPVKGIETKEPAFGLDAVWITEDKKEVAEMHGYTVIEPSAMIATHLSEIIKNHADMILTRQDVSKMLDNVKKDNETVVTELVPNLLSIGNIEKVLKNLLRESVPIRDMVTVLETLADYAPATRDIETLTEYVRFALSRTIAKKFIASDGIVYGITLDPALEQLVNETVNQLKQKNYSSSLAPEIVSVLYSDLRQAQEEMLKKGLTPVIIVTPNIRAYLRRLIEPSLPTLPVISYNEIPTHIPLQSFLSVSHKQK